MSEFPYIDQRGSRDYLLTGPADGEQESVDLLDIFIEYEMKAKLPRNVVRAVDGLKDESEVHKAAYYWTSTEGTYRRLEKEAEAIHDFSEPEEEVLGLYDKLERKIISFEDRAEGAVFTREFPSDTAWDDRARMSLELDKDNPGAALEILVSDPVAYIQRYIDGEPEGTIKVDDEEEAVKVIEQVFNGLKLA